MFGKLFGKSKTKLISAQEAKAMIDAGGVTVVDVRTPQEFAQKRIPGTINIPNETINGTRPAQLPDLNAKILIHCLSGGRSAMAARKLADMGYTDVYDFGGIGSWPYETLP